MIPPVLASMSTPLTLRYADSREIVASISGGAGADGDGDERASARKDDVEMDEERWELDVGALEALTDALCMVWRRRRRRRGSTVCVCPDNGELHVEEDVYCRC